MIHHDVKRKNQPQRLHTQTLSTNNSPPGAELPSAAGATAAAKPLGGQKPRLGKGNYGQFSGAVLARLLLQAQSCPLPPGHCCSKAPGGPTKTRVGRGSYGHFFRGWLWKPLRTFAPSVPHRPSTESSTCQNTGQTQTFHAAGHQTQVGEANLHALGQTRGQISAANVGATAGKRGHPQSIGKMHAFHPSPLQSGVPVSARPPFRHESRRNGPPITSSNAGASTEEDSPLRNAGRQQVFPPLAASSDFPGSA